VTCGRDQNVRRLTWFPFLFVCVDVMQELKDFLLKCFIRDVNLRPGPDELLKHPWICKNVQPVRLTPHSYSIFNRRTCAL
jgi:serine/threonine protein kinase